MLHDGKACILLTTFLVSRLWLSKIKNLFAWLVSARSFSPPVNKSFTHQKSSKTSQSAAQAVAWLTDYKKQAKIRVIQPRCRAMFAAQ